MELQREPWEVVLDDQKLTLTAPSKTFFCGEYVAVGGGPCLVAATAPRYTLTVTPGIDLGSANFIFHPDSPAGQLASTNADFLEKLHLKFEGPEGLGSSSAQFLLLYALIKSRGNLLAGGPAEFDFREVLKNYRQMDPLNSGADVVTQLLGGLVWFQRRTGHAEKIHWEFKDLGFFLVKTPLKVATHNHLRDLQLPDLTHLWSVVDSARGALKALDEQVFLESLTVFRNELNRFNLVHANTNQAQELLDRCDGVRFVKGCGALGADVLLVLVSSGQREIVRAFIEQNRLGTIFATEADFTRGLQID